MSQKSIIQFAIYFCLFLIAPLLAIIAVFGHNRILMLFVVLIGLIMAFVWPKCTNCGLLYSNGHKLIDENNLPERKSGITSDFNLYGPRYVPGKCARCGQDHFNPDPEENDD